MEKSAIRRPDGEETGKRLASLDGLRGIAACALAFVFHARLILTSSTNPFAGVPGLDWLQLYGWAMVDLFFVLSGFVFAHCYLDGWRMRRGVSGPSFVVARLARLWPLHLVTLAFAALLLRELDSTTPANIVISALFGQVFLEEPTNTLNGPAWSLSVEMICYGIFACAAFAGGRWLRATCIIALAVGIASIAVYGGGALIGRGLAGFFIGVIICRLLDRTARIPTWMLIACLCLAFVVPPRGSALIVTLCLAWPAAILLALRSRLLGTRVFTWIGDRSYTIYLVHVPIYLTAQAAVGERIGQSMLLTLTTLLMCWIVILVISNTLYRSFERPAQRAILSAYHQRKQSAAGRGRAKALR